MNSLWRPPIDSHGFAKHTVFCFHCFEAHNTFLMVVAGSLRLFDFSEMSLEDIDPTSSIWAYLDDPAFFEDGFFSGDELYQFNDFMELVDYIEDRPEYEYPFIDVQKKKLSQIESVFHVSSVAVRLLFSYVIIFCILT